VKVLVEFVVLYLISMTIFVGIIAVGIEVFKSRHRQ